jgi:hypothetical protein
MFYSSLCREFITNTILGRAKECHREKYYGETYIIKNHEFFPSVSFQHYKQLHGYMKNGFIQNLHRKAVLKLLLLSMSIICLYIVHIDIITDRHKYKCLNIRAEKQCFLLERERETHRMYRNSFGRRSETYHNIGSE